MELIKLEPAYKDQRGVIIDLIANEDVNAVTLITFTKGAVRANHYHKHTIQWNYVISGKILLVTQIPGEQKVEKILRSGDFAVTRENEHHAIKGISEAEVLIITKGPRAGDKYENDTFRLDKLLID
jgi:quercetin dioxygenase-like cupin family protein